MKILAFAYACEPEKGSESGAGWAWARMLARIGEVWILTRTSNRAAIEAALERVPEKDHLHFVYVDLPERARLWKRGQRGVRTYYLLWQLLALRRARELRDEIGFDLVWHLTFANAWLGSVAPLLGRTFVYGPVGGGVGTPWRLLPALGLKGGAYEVLRVAARAAGRYLNPLARLAWRRAALVLVQNAETKEWLPRRHQMKALVFPNAVIDTESGQRSQVREKPSTALFAGRLLPLKGALLAIEAVARAPGWRLLIAGDGPDAARLKRHARSTTAADRVEFLGWQRRDDVLRLMREEADVFLFPSLHDEAGWAVVEALSCGLPVICLGRGGPPTLAGPAGLVVSGNGERELIVRSLADQLVAGALPDEDVVARRKEMFCLEARARKLTRLVEELPIASAISRTTPLVS